MNDKMKMVTELELDLEYAVVDVFAEVLALEERSHLNYCFPLCSLDLILQPQRHVANEMLDYGDK